MLIVIVVHITPYKNVIFRPAKKIGTAEKMRAPLDVAHFEISVCATTVLDVIIGTMFLANRPKSKPKDGEQNSQSSKPAEKKTASSALSKPKPAEPKPRGKSLAARTALPTSKPEPKWGWENSWAKEILREAIKCGDITSDHTYDEMHVWHPEVEKTDRQKLPGRVRGLRQQVDQDKTAAQSDAIALAHDRKLFPIPDTNYRGEPRWQGSNAEKILKSDIKDGKHLLCKPSEYYQLHKEYEPYSVDVIRAHIYQEVKFQKYCLYRNDKKKSQFLTFRK